MRLANFGANSSLNRTILELKHVIARIDKEKRLFFKSYHFGIETSLIQVHHSCEFPLNRTILELKQLSVIGRPPIYLYFKSYHFGIETDGCFVG